VRRGEDHDAYAPRAGLFESALTFRIPACRMQRDAACASRQPLTVR
jgi:hypothetical protein